MEAIHQIYRGIIQLDYSRINIAAAARKGLMKLQ